jgi:hypothetical protein
MRRWKICSPSPLDPHQFSVVPRRSRRDCSRARQRVRQVVPASAARDGHCSASGGRRYPRAGDSSTPPWKASPRARPWSRSREAFGSPWPDTSAPTRHGRSVMHSIGIEVPVLANQVSSSKLVTSTTRCFLPVGHGIPVARVRIHAIGRPSVRMMRYGSPDIPRRKDDLARQLQDPSWGADARRESRPKIPVPLLSVSDKVFTFAWNSGL